MEQFWVKNGFNNMKKLFDNYYTSIYRGNWRIEYLIQQLNFWQKIWLANNINDHQIDIGFVDEINRDYKLFI